MCISAQKLAILFRDEYPEVKFAAVFRNSKRQSADASHTFYVRFFTGATLGPTVESIMLLIALLYLECPRTLEL